MTTLTLNPTARHELKIFGLLAAVFAAVYFLPVGQPRFDGAVTEALELTKWYAREHVVLCLLPAFWIAGAIAAFVSQASVMRYLGPMAPKPLAYGVGSVSGTILAVCSCTVLPLFSGIYRMGAGLGPATAFLYSGPAINVLAIVMTAKVLGAQLGLARAVGAVAFSVVIGLLMALIFRQEEQQKAASAVALAEPEAGRPLSQTAAFFAVLVGILVFANWGAASQTTGFFAAVFSVKWVITSVLGGVLALLLWRWFKLDPKRIAVVIAATAVFAVALPGHPTWPFLVAILGLAWLTAGRRGRGRRVVQPGLGLHQADRATTARRRACGRIPARSPRPRGHDSLRVDQRTRRRQLARVQPVRRDRRRVHVFRDTDRGPDRAGPRRQRHGLRSGPRAAARRPCAKPAGHAGSQLDSRPEEDCHLRLAGRRHGDDHGHGVRPPGELMRGRPAGDDT